MILMLELFDELSILAKRGIFNLPKTDCFIEEENRVAYFYRAKNIANASFGFADKLYARVSPAENVECVVADIDVDSLLSEVAFIVSAFLIAKYYPVRYKDKPAISFAHWILCSTKNSKLAERFLIYLSYINMILYENRTYFEPLSVYTLTSDDINRLANHNIEYSYVYLSEYYSHIELEKNLIRHVARWLGLDEHIVIRPNSRKNYLDTRFISELIADAKTVLTTGFKQLDEYLNITDKFLCVIGGTPGIGKTTFAIQLAEHLLESALRNEDIKDERGHVIYFSIEQTAKDITLKSVTRNTCRLLNSFRYDPAAGLSSSAVRSYFAASQASGKLPGPIETAMKYTRFIINDIDYSDRFNVVEGKFYITIENVRRYIESYIDLNSDSHVVKPIVVIDYLQILRADDDVGTLRERVDYVVTELREMAIEYNLIVFVISSFNREAYYKPVDFTSFKESGGIEYTADATLGLQLKIVETGSEKLDKQKIVSAYDGVVERGGLRFREVRLVGLKNRHGNMRTTIDFKYYPDRDLFIEA